MSDHMNSEPMAHLAVPNRLQRFRATYGEYFAEMFGAGMIILFGAGAQLQTQLYGAGDYLSCGFGECRAAGR